MHKKTSIFKKSSGMRVCYFCIVFIATIMIFPDDAMSAPSKPEVSSDENSLTLSGNGFGNKDVSAPLKFEDFESGIEGANINSNPYWSSRNYSGGSVPVYSNIDSRQGSNLHSRHILPVGGASEISTPYYDTELSGDNRKLYISFWYWYDRLDSDTDCQLKMWRIYNSTGGLYPSLAYYNRLASASFELRSSIGDSCSDADWQSTGWGLSDSLRTWQLMEAVVDVGTLGGNNGTWEIYVDNVKETDGSGTDNVCQDTACQFHSIRFGEWHADLNCEAHDDITLWDDIYIDNSWSRVKVCNFEKTHCEIQVPISWSDTSIVVEKNSGSFSSSEIVYAYVFNGDGQESIASEGFTFGDISITPNTEVYYLANFISTITNWLQIGNETSDVNSDGVVNTRDLGVVMSGWGEQ